MKLLLVEDEKHLAAEISSFISKEDFVWEAVYDYNSALQKINLYEYDCAIIDITLPGGSGLELIKLLKKISKKTGIIIISAKNSLSDKLTGLNLGADDYLTKPFHLAELNARIQSVLRRRRFDGENEIHFGEIIINLDKREASINNKILNLTRKEYDLLLYFISNEGKVLTKESIAEHIWGDNADSFDSLDFIYSQIKNLRKKMIEAGCNDYLKSIYGVGYKFTNK